MRFEPFSFAAGVDGLWCEFHWHFNRGDKFVGAHINSVIEYTGLTIDVGLVRVVCVVGVAGVYAG